MISDLNIITNVLRNLQSFTLVFEDAGVLFWPTKLRFINSLSPNLVAAGPLAILRRGPRIMRPGV